MAKVAVPVSCLKWDAQDAFPNEVTEIFQGEGAWKNFQLVQVAVWASLSVEANRNSDTTNSGTREYIAHLRWKERCWLELARCPGLVVALD